MCCLHVASYPDLLCSVVPGPPQMVVVRSSSSGIVISWRKPNCSDVNDERVTGYQVRYGELSGTQKRTTPTITSGTRFTISGDGLSPFTDYSIEVAAVNSRGLGAFTQPKIGVITGGENLRFEISFLLLFTITRRAWESQFIVHCS